MFVRVTATVYVVLATALNCFAVTDTVVSSLSASAVLLGLLLGSVAVGIVVAEQWVVALPFVAFALTGAILLALGFLGEVPADGQAGAVVLIHTAIGLAGVAFGRWITGIVTDRR